MNSLFFSLLFSLAIAAQDIGFYNAGLDPAPLKWWQTKWCNNPVELGMTNKGMTTTVTFNISPYTTLSLGVLEVTFPTGFDVTSATCSHVTPCVTTVSSQLVSIPSITVTAGSDYSFTIGGVILPTSTGGYGPIALRTRHFTGGQTADINLNFASVGIFKDRGNLTNLAVTTVSSSIKVGATGNTLSFRFQIAKDLWKNDIFRITASQYWTISATSTCRTAKYSGRINNFNGTRSADPYNLDCYISPKTTPTTAQVVYIYGLNNDIDVSASDDNKYVDLRLTSVSNPDADYSDSSYTWTVETLRGQTKSVIEYATYSSGPSTDPGTLTSVSFTPTWGWSSTNVLPGHYIYTNLGFTTVNKISQGGSAEVVYTDTIDDTGYDCNTTDDCWLHNYLTYTVSGATTTAKCVGSSKTAIISGLPEVAAGTTLTITVLTYFDTTTPSGSATATVTTRTSGSVEIDKASGLGGLILGNSSKNNVPTTFTLGISDGTVDLKPDTQRTDTTTSLAGDTATAETIMFKIDPVTEDFTDNTQITVKFPFIQSTSVQNFEFAIPSGVTYYLQSLTDGTVALTTTIASSSLTITPSSAGIITNGAGLGSYVFKAVAPPLVGCKTYFGAQGSTNTQIRLPRYKSNAATRYEAYLETKDMASKPTLKSQYGVWQIEIVTNTFATGVVVLCTGPLNAMPLKLVITPNTVDVPAAASSTTYTLELDFTTGGGTTDLGSGLSDGNDYPYTLATSTFSSFTLGYGSPSYLKGKLASTIPAASTNSILYTVVYSQSAAFTPIHRGYYTINADPRNKYQTHEETGTAAALNTATGNVVALTTSNTTPSIGISTAVTTWDEAGLKLSFEMADTTGVEWAISYPRGWTIASGATVEDSAAASVTSTNLSPSSRSTTRYFFKLTTQLFTEGTFVIADPSDVIFKGAISSNYVLPNAEIIFSIGSTDVWGNACIDYNTVVVGTGKAYSMTAGTITVVSISPNSIKGRGPASVNLTEVVRFTVPHLIPAGGNIIATVHSGWGVASPASCSVSGLSNQSTTLTVTATLSSTTCTVINFAEVSANSSITLTFTGLLPPTYTSSTSNTPQTFLSSIVSNFIISGTTYLIDTTSTAVVVTIAAPTAPGRSSFVTKTTYPMNASTTDLDLYLKFSLANSVPRGGVLELTSPLTFKISSTNTMNQVWLSPLKYSAVSFSSSTLSITLAEDYTADTMLELFIDKAVDNPTSTTATSTGFTLKSSWGDVTINTDDSQTLLSTQKFTASAALTSTLKASTSNSLTFSPTTASEYATYSFSFKSSVKFAKGDQIWIVTPDQFDPYVGMAWVWFTNESTTYYISCTSSQLGTTWCKVDHNIIVVTGSSEVDASTDIAITISNVKNPAEAKTDNFQIVHVDSTGAAKSFNSAFGTVTPTAMAYNIEIRRITPGDRDLFNSGSYTFLFYLSETFATTNQIRVWFPMEYDLSKEDKKDSYTCSTTRKDDSDSATNKSEQTWNTNTSCTASMNWITLPVPTTSRIFASTDIVTLTVTSVGNPQWAQSRSAATGWDFDATDSDVWTLYDLWTSNFEVFVYNTASTSLAYTARSYGVLSRAYLGFTRSRKQLMVNSYNDQYISNRIVVFAGSQSTNIAISTESTSKPLSAKKIVFYPATNSRTSDSGKLAYTSYLNAFTLWQDEYSLNFRVAAKVDLGKGLYYIDWTIDESLENGLTENAYNRPVKTLVEVVAKTSKKYKFAVSTIPAIYKRGKSAPIKISIDNAPASNVIITLSITGTLSGVSVSPSSITFSPNVNSAYFQVSVASTANPSSSTNTVSLALSGTDADVYSIDATVPFTVTNSAPTSGSITSWGIGTCTRVSCSVTPSCDEVGTLYWQLAAKGSTILSFDELTSEVGSVITSSDSTSGAAQLDSQIAETDPAEGETWVEFQQRVYQAHVMDYWIGGDAVVTTADSFTRNFYWLYAGTKYQISGYLDNGYSTNSPAKTEYFTTVATYDSQPFAVKFTGSVLDSFTSRIAEVTAQYQGVNPDRLINRVRTATTSRALQATTTSTTFAMTLASDRSAQDPAPSDQAKIEGTNLTGFKATLKSAGIPNDVDSVVNTAVQSKTTPTWTTSPDVDSVTNNQVTMTLRSSVAGETCCIAVDDSMNTMAPSSEQLYLGLASTNVEVPAMCIITDTTKASNSVTVSGLDSGTDYTVYCTAVDSFPIWPTHMSFTDDKVTGYSITTSGSTHRRDDSSSASAMTAVFSLLALTLFN
jgi:hypothetical protein